MGWFGVGLGGWATWRLWQQGSSVLATLAAASTLIAFWSYGVLHNYATQNARRRPDYRGGFFDLTQRDVEAAPDWPSAVNMIATLVGFILLIASFVLR